MGSMVLMRSVCGSTSASGAPLTLIKPFPDLHRATATAFFLRPNTWTEFTLGEADAMVIACERNGVKLAIGHQRRFYSSWTEAKRMVQAGEIGKPVRLWSAVRAGMMNTGTHCLDFQLYVLGNVQPLWVMGAVERQTDHYIFGHRVEDQTQFCGRFSHELRDQPMELH